MILNKGFKLIWYKQLGQLNRIKIGLFYQSFALESSDGNYLFLTRSHERTHKFVDFFVDTIHNCEDVFDPIESYNTNKQIVQDLSQILNRGKDIDLRLYLLIWQISEKITEKSKDSVVLSKKSLIITKNSLFLCNENYSLSQKENSQFQVSDSTQLSDIIGIEILSNNQVFIDKNISSIKTDKSIGILYENSETGNEEKLYLITENQQEQEKIIQVISRLWKALFKLELKIEKE